MKYQLSYFKNPSARQVNGVLAFLDGLPDSPMISIFKMYYAGFFGSKLIPIGSFAYEHNNEHNNENEHKMNRTGTEHNNEQNKVLVASDKITFDYSSGIFINLSPEKMQFYKVKFPAVNIKTEVLKMEAWASANPKNRKSNWDKFITAWISRVQDKAPTGKVVKGAIDYSKYEGGEVEYK